MTIQSIVAKATRNLHHATVKLHLKSLRNVVTASERSVGAAAERMNEAEAILCAARSNSQQACKNYQLARIGHGCTELAAHQEAARIGGSL